MNKLLFIFLLGSKGFLLDCMAQGESKNTSQQGGSCSIYALMSMQYDNDRHERSSDIGAGVRYDVRYSSNFGWMATLDYRSWEEFRIRLIPLHIGPVYFTDISSNVSSSIGIGVGPSAIIGNDFAGFGAGASLQADLFIDFSSDIAFLFGLGYGGAWLWHPSQFGYLDIRAGVPF